MIALVTSSARERTAFGALCACQGWPAIECASVRALQRAVAQIRLKAVLVRSKLTDGYSDDVITALNEAQALPGTKIIVLLEAGASSSEEARQINLGADCVLRDPVRSDALVSYLDKYHRAPHGRMPSLKQKVPTGIPFAGGALLPKDRQLQRGRRTAAITPREVQLAEVFIHFSGEVVTYETLYDEILNRRFRGDTSIMRVLLGKLKASAQSVGIPFKKWVQVIPKLGYRYHPK
jgi:DNA-binding response OmpR family regulator